MNKKTLLIVIVCAVILLALVCLLVGALSGQMPWETPEDYDYNPQPETTEPSAPEETETVDTTPQDEGPDATEPSTAPSTAPTTPPTLPKEEDIKVNEEVQVPTQPTTGGNTDSTDSTESTENTGSTEGTTESTEPPATTEKDTTQVEDPENEKVAGSFEDLMNRTEGNG